MFTRNERSALRDALVAAARADHRIDGAAVTGSAASGAEDGWSDVDLAFGLAEGADQAAVIADWTAAMYERHGAVAHLDVPRGATIYRVFLLASTLQVDIAFAPAAEFGAIAPTFRLLFGTARDVPVAAPPEAAGLVGMGWLYALHARSSIERGRGWQALYMINGLRDQVVALACLQHDLPAWQGRGVDGLPAAVTQPLLGTLVGALDDATLRRAFAVATEALLAEAAHVDPALAERLAGPLRAMTDAGRSGAAGQEPQ
ncbi:nucleotidyltransferase domain-containing protein [Jiangella aurantiaca]|uniref:Nucleotidyltransferase domain-containing protein n=1 Tax=Jiangella aurantiaca TaxID=2530373 RepID=A0A4R5AKC8_9ACTN|nr:nucleotidyltransferase domain-containing protein [Jiangella aurantiaca]TDD73103.1 nucleotidyltransferase domain-containing protein [Jiangella aurantiaca]